MRKIILIDDDNALAEPLETYFARFGFQLISADTPSAGLEKLASEQPELVILDVMLPEMDGFEVCRLIRKSSDIPIIMLTARGEVTDRVVGLELGADDYLPKPFEPRELVARIQNILRRVKHESKTESHLLQFDDLVIDVEAQKVMLSDKEITLTGTEFGLLALLAGSPGKAFTRDEILNALKGVDAQLFTRAVDIAISRLRKKLLPTEYIKTVWGAGYRFVGETE